MARASQAQPVLFPARGRMAAVLCNSRRAPIARKAAFRFPTLPDGAPVSSFIANFQLFIGNGSPNAADGIGFNFAPSIPVSTAGEEGSGSGINVNFDTY